MTGCLANTMSNRRRRVGDATLRGPGTDWEAIGL